jgi:cholesterol transport system auxiliary component
MRPALPFKFAAVGLLALSLSGCVSLVPKTKPAQLYRFGVPTAQSPARTDPVGVYRVRGGFQREASGDRILTVTGERAAYIAQSRWVAPAEVLFDEAVAAAFDSAPGRVRLVLRGEPARAAYLLRLDVRNFETVYDGDNPVVLVRVRASLAGGAERSPIADRLFEARVPAERNRVSAIVAAYNDAVAKVLNDIVSWTNSSAA